MTRKLKTILGSMLATCLLFAGSGCELITAKTVIGFAAKQVGKKVVKKAIKDHKEKKAAEEGTGSD